MNTEEVMKKLNLRIRELSPNVFTVCDKDNSAKIYGIFKSYNDADEAVKMFAYILVKFVKVD